jgi:hypothetical protein
MLGHSRRALLLAPPPWLIGARLAIGDEGWAPLLRAAVGPPHKPLQHGCFRAEDVQAFCRHQQLGASLQSDEAHREGSK